LTGRAIESGCLWVVATPLGNLDDLSPRARDILATADILAAEDTRISRKLLPPRPSSPRWVTLHEHNESAQSRRLVDELQQGRSVALISDAGTPLVSDPGYRLVSACHDAGIRVSPVPGPCAAIAALSAAGLASDRFSFEGFLPPRAGPRRTRLASLASHDQTLLLYVPARDLPEIVREAAQSFGPSRLATVARELTKRFETIRRGSLGDLAQWLEQDPDQQRGEAVLAIAGVPAGQPACNLDADLLARELAAELPPARAARILARVTGLPRKQAFARIERLRAATASAS